MKVLFAYKVAPELMKHYQTSLNEKVELIFPSVISEESLLKLAYEIEIFVGYKVSAEFLNKAHKLKHIQVPWTGSETLDFGLLKNFQNITVSNSHSNSLAIAEHAIALLFATAKNIVYSDRKMRNGDWGSRYELENDGQWICNKTLGVIGYGAIGQKIAHILKTGFQMKVLAIRRQIPSIETENFYDFIGTQENLDYVLKESDFIIISLPLTNDTKGLIGEEQFLMMKRSAIIVNISRGAIIDEKSLYYNLKEKKIAGAGIDVWYNYPKDRINPINVLQNYHFHELDNIVMTPHAAFKVVNREEIFSEDIIKNILLVSEGKQPINKLNLEAGY